MKKMTDRQREDLKKLRALERECQRDRKKFFAEIDENLDDVVKHLEERGFVVMPADAVGKKKVTDGGKADDTEGGFSSLFSGDDDSDEAEATAPNPYYRTGAE